MGDDGYYVHGDGQTTGPFGCGQIAQMFASRHIGPSHQIHDGEEWVPVAVVLKIKKANQIEAESQEAAPAVAAAKHQHAPVARMRVWHFETPHPAVAAAKHQHAPAPPSKADRPKYYDERTVSPAGFWIRACALCLDSIVCSLIPVGISFLGGGRGITALMTFLFYVLNFIVLPLSDLKGTIGKGLLGLEITTTGGDRISFSRLICRNLAWKLPTLVLVIVFKWRPSVDSPIGSILIPVCFLAIPFLMAGFGHKLALHDLLAGTQVIRVKIVRKTRV